MYPFRKHTPKHRKSRKVCKNYRSYKKTLRADFVNRCGYCNDWDYNRLRSYVIDHFVPQNPDGWTHNIPPNRYKNLIYSCTYCNGSKLNKWPTKIKNVENDGDVGFVKPTRKLYSSLFRRGVNGSIMVHNRNPVGEYMHRELKLYLQIHELNWKFEKMFSQEEELKKLVKTTSDPILQENIVELQKERLKILDEILKLYNI